MKDSVIYQELREEARAEAFEQVRREERLNGERSLVLRQLTRKVGTIPPALQTQIEQLSVTDLEDLGEALLGFESVADLEAWLERPAE